MEERRITEHDTQIEERDGETYIGGYGAVFYDPNDPGTEGQVGSNLYERFDPHAFDRVLAERQNIEIRYNHSDDYVLGTVEGGASVRVDSKGLRYSLRYNPEDPDHQKVKAKVKQGLIKGSSIGFLHDKVRWSEENGKHIVTVMSVKVVRDVGPVNIPAYSSSHVQVRSAALEESYNKWLQQREETEKRFRKLDELTK